MNLVFHKIHLHNFFSFTDAELALTDMGYTLVEGRNYCKLDNAYSNGSGKSSIFNGICFALTGETAQGVSSGVENIFSNPDDCWVELIFNVDSDEFILRRYKTPRPDMKIWVNGEDKSGKGIRESSKLLASYLPDLTPTLINSIIILGQGLPNRFTNNNPAQRKEILEKLTKSDFMIQSIKDKLEIRQNELKSDLRAQEDNVLVHNSRIQVYNSQLKDYNKELESYSEFINSEDNLDQQICSIEKKTALINEFIEAEKVSQLRLNNLIDDLSNANTDLYAQKLDTKELDEQISNLNKELTDESLNIKILSKEIKQLDSITDICPTCGQKIPNVSRPDTTEKKVQLKELEDNYNIKKLEFDNLCVHKGELVEEFDNKIMSEAAENNEQIKLYKSELKESQSAQTKLSSELLDLNTKLNKLKNLKSNYEKLLENISTTIDKVSELSKEVDKINIEIIDLNGRLSIIQQMITLARREFRGILLLNIIDYINKKVKQYSREVFDTEELEFTLDENAIDISYCGKPYENLSGGEKQKIDIIVQLALREVLSKQINIHSNLLCLDEIFDNLDSQGCSKIINLISKLTDIDSVFIISHHIQDLELTKDNSIVVEKNEDGISSIKVV